MADHTQMKLGKLAPRNDPRTLKLTRYIDRSKLPTPPAETNRVTSSDVFPMFLNDQLGDCTCAAAAHMQQVWGYLVGPTETFTDDDVLKMYEVVSGYNPDDPSSDAGAVEINVLNYWRKVGLAGRKIDAYAQVHVSDVDLVRAAAWLFDGLYIGIGLPVTAQSQGIWDVVPDAGADGQPGSWGGHAVNVTDYDESGLTVITWGAAKKMTWAFWDAYVDEAYAVLSSTALNPQGVTYEGLAIATLQSDLEAVTQ